MGAGRNGTDPSTTDGRPAGFARIPRRLGLTGGVLHRIGVQERRSRLALRLLENMGAEAAAAVDAEADRLAGWLADVRVTPRFRTPLERELSG